MEYVQRAQPSNVESEKYAKNGLQVRTYMCM